MAGLEADLDDLKLHDTGGYTDVDDLAELVAEKSLGDGGGAADLLFLEVGLGVGYDGILHSHAVGVVFDLDTVEYLHFFVVEIALVDDARVGYEVFELGYLHFEHTLGLLGGVILGVFREVAFVAGLGDGC